MTGRGSESQLCTVLPHRVPLWCDFVEHKASCRPICSISAPAPSSDSRASPMGGRPARARDAPVAGASASMRESVVRLAVAGAEAFAELAAIELLVAEVSTIAVVGIAPVVMALHRERAPFARVLLAGIAAVAEAVVVRDAFGFDAVAARRLAAIH